MTTSHFLLRSVLFSCFLLIQRLPGEFNDVKRCVSTQSFTWDCSNQESLFHGSANECLLLWSLSSSDHQNSSTWDICICLDVYDIPEVETTTLSSSLRKITTKPGSLPTLSEANDLVALAYITQIVVPAFIFLSCAVETLKQTQVQRSRKNVKNVNGP